MKFGLEFGQVHRDVIRRIGLAVNSMRGVVKSGHSGYKLEEEGLVYEESTYTWSFLFLKDV